MSSASHASSPTTFYGSSIGCGTRRRLISCVRSRATGGLEKYVMTKLFNRTFARSLEDAKFDQEISEKIYLLQHFIKPEHLDVPEIFHNEASWLVINNLLINASVSSDHVPAGADEFLPVIIYVTIKARSHR
ncbi:Vacuolar protein sorting-associated protein 9A [Acorus calamus]|uniref:Vacuolar protein sorting-associated protein 9A n=1 Tax=Acorus calamus TaxID=4465 RepID=A0AAV9EBI0_ACOCL|nr:Vacuolar protein sorting-associated protein 9A [Acorus calamus]